MVDARTAHRLREIKAAEKRAQQLRRNAQEGLAADMRRTSSNREGFIRDAKANIAKAAETTRQIQALKEQGNAKIRDIQQVIAQGNISTQIEKKNRQSNSNAGSAEAAQQVGNNFDKGFTKETKELGYQSTGSDFEEARKETASQILESQKPKPEPVKAESTGTGSTTDPIKNKQPDLRKVSPLIKKQQNTLTQPITKPTSQKIQVVTPDGEVRIFNSKDSAERFVQRYETANRQEGSFVGFGENGIPIQGPGLPTTERVITPIGMGGLITAPLVQVNANSSNLLEAFGKNTYNALRYSDAVDRGEVAKPKGVELLNYYASVGLRPLYNIPLALSGDKTMASTFTDEVLNTGIDVVTKGKTKTHDPVGDYVKADPLKTVIQIPGEVALWVVGAKATQLGAKAFQKALPYSPLRFQKLKFPINNKMETVYKGLTVNDKPLIGIQDGKVVRGIDVEKLPFEKVDANKFGRYGWEPTQSSGIASETIFASKGLDNMVKKKIITKLDKERVDTFVDLFDETKHIKPKVGSFSDLAIDGLTQKQTDFLMDFAKAGQKSGKVDTLHGSTALQPQIAPSLRAKAGSNLKMGDLDLTPKGKNLPKVASDLIQQMKDFPLEKGQSIKIVDDITNLKKNKELTLIQSGKKDKKVLEVVLEERNASGTDNLTRMGDKVLNEKLSSKTVNADGLKLHEKRFQLQENVRTALGFHKGTDGTQFNVFASEGRTKDIVRSYWNFKDDALIVGGEKGKRINAKAEKLRSLYNIDFEDVARTESKQVLLLSSSKPSKQIIDNKINFDVTEKLTKPTDIPVSKKPELKIETNVKLNLASKRLTTKPASSKIKTSSNPSSKSTIIDLDVFGSNLSSVVSSTFTKGRRFSTKSSTASPSVTLNSPKPSSKPSSKFASLEFPSVKFDSPGSSGYSSTKNPPAITIIPPGKGGIKIGFGISPKRQGKKTILPIIGWGGAKRVKPKRKVKDDKVIGFLGNSSDYTVTQLFNRKEVIYNKKKIVKSEKQDSDLYFGTGRKPQSNKKKSRKGNKNSFADVDLNF